MLYAAIVLLFAGFLIFMASYVKTDTAKGAISGSRGDRQWYRKQSLLFQAAMSILMVGFHCYHVQRLDSLDLVLIAVGGLSLILYFRA